MSAGRIERDHDCRLHLSPNRKKITMKTSEQRFLDKVLIPDDQRACWEWQASKNSSGYGQPTVKSKKVLAHRYSYLMFNGNPEGLVVRHSCDNPGCVNPNHLLLGTIADNNRDRDLRGRLVSANAKKTHCSSGHEFNKENTLIRTNGNRFCRTCNRARCAILRARKKIAT